jgi:thioesterase domain-containing protein
MRAFIKLAALASVFMATVSLAHAKCALDGETLACAGDNREAVTMSLASEETRQLFADPLAVREIFEDKPQARESFRRSLEAVRRSVERHHRKMTRDERRGRLTDAAFNAHEATYEKALANYAEGYWFYKNLTWQTD